MSQQQQYYSTQPAPMQQMNAGGNRNSLNKPTDSKGQREWSFGFCDCFAECGTCVIATIFPCVTYAQNKSRLEHLERHGAPHPDGGSIFNFDCCCHAVLTGCCALGWVLQIGQRSHTRARYGVNGNGCNDCLAAACCPICELTQGSREIELEEQSFGGHAKR